MIVMKTLLAVKVDGLGSIEELDFPSAYSPGISATLYKNMSLDMIHLPAQPRGRARARRWTAISGAALMVRKLRVERAESEEKENG